jgi:hypothetical protein
MNNNLLVLGSVIVLFFSGMAVAQETPYNLQDLIGARASSGESQLRSRGYSFVKTTTGGDRKWSNWWANSSRTCITVATVDGRFDTIISGTPLDCNRSANGGFSNGGGGWNGNTSAPPSWAIGTFYSSNIQGYTMTITGSGQITLSGPDGTQSGRWNRNSIDIGNVSYPATRSGNGLRAYNQSTRTYTDYSRSGGSNNGGWNNNNSGNWGWGGGNSSNVPGLGKAGVTVYDDRNFRGTSQTFGVGRYLNNAGQFGALRNDEASSVMVLNGYKVRFCEGEGDGNGSGKCDEYGAGRYNLRLNDEASYIEVTRAYGGGNWGNNDGGGYWGNNSSSGSWGGAAKINDLAGLATITGNARMMTRGFRLVDTMRQTNTTYTIWWRSNSNQCVQVTVANGRYDSVNDIGSHPRCR